MRANEESATIHWSGFWIWPCSTFGILEDFPDKAARDAHLSGQYAEELMASAVISSLSPASRRSIWSRPSSLETTRIADAKRLC
jgi:hypothetical protein